MSGSLVIRPARPGEAALVLQFLNELAAYEKLTHEVHATEAMIEAALFGPQACVTCDFAEWDGETVGFALWLLNFSTFSGRAGLFLEDLFVRPAFRGKGIGKALMAHLARRCVENGWARMQWDVLDWNTPSIEFYKSLGAVMAHEWIGVPLVALMRLHTSREGTLMQIVLIAAVADNGVIGQGGTMPWRLKSDMRHFRALTTEKPVVMGRKTWLSLSIKPLPRRTNIVVTRDPSFSAPGVLVGAEP